MTFQEFLQLLAYRTILIELATEYADTNGASTAPVIDDFINAGIVGVTPGNIGAINAIIAGLVSTDVDTIAEIQAIVTAYIIDLIEEYANTNGTSTAPTVEDYEAIGVVGVTPGNVDAINAIIAGLNPIDVDTVVEIQAIVDAYIFDIIEEYANSNGTSTAPTVDDYEAIGVVGVTPDNVDAINTIIAGLNPADVDTVEEIQAIVDAYIIDVIEEYANTNGTSTAPTVEDYETIGVIGVTEDNIDFINDAVAGSDPVDVDTVAEIQALLDSLKYAVVAFPSMTVQIAADATGVYVFGTDVAFAPMSVVASEAAYAFGNVVSAPMEASAAEFFDTITIISGSAVFQPMQAQASGIPWFEPEVTATFPPMETLASEAAYAQASAVFIPLQGFAEGQQNTEIFDTPYFNIRLPAMRSTQEIITDTDILDMVLVDADVDEHYTNYVLDRSRAASLLQTFYTPQAQVADIAGAVDALALGLKVQFGDTLEVADLLDFTQIVQVLDRVRALAVVQTYYAAMVALLETVGAQDAEVHGPFAIVTDTINVTDETLLALLRVAVVLDAVTAADTQELGLQIIVVESLEATAEDTVQVVGTYSRDILEHADAFVTFRWGDEQFTGWVMNVEGDQPVSEYRNYNFNSFAHIGEHYFGASDEGMFLLDGNTDDGAPIEASLLTMMIDFGTPRMKRVRSAYIGYTADGRLMLRVRAVSNGQLNEQWYEAQELPAQAPREQMVRVGRGLRSRYWQFELVNMDGADFEIDKMELHPVVLNRRV